MHGILEYSNSLESLSICSLSVLFSFALVIFYLGFHAIATRWTNKFVDTNTKTKYEYYSDVEIYWPPSGWCLFVDDGFQFANLIK